VIISILFIFFAVAAIAAALYILFSKSLIYSAFALLATFVSVAAVFILSGAGFVGIAQIMIYVGGILILLIFGIMLTKKVAIPLPNTTFGQKFRGILAAGAVFTVFLTVILSVNFETISWISASASTNRTLEGSTISAIGIKLMTAYILPFELSALVLMIALIGAGFIAKRFKES
jgi:NADH-quinone oxidoreductase subunit J